MARDRTAGRSKTKWALAIGAVTGIATGLMLWRRSALGEDVATRREVGRTEAQLREALAADSVLGRRDIDVGTVAEGIIELTGTVRDEKEAEHAVTVAQRIPGVRTVLNRLDEAVLEDHLSGTRQRLRDGDPSLLETHWYGMRVGTGQRRQGRVTDPDRPSDRVPILSRELGTDHAVLEASEPMDKVPTGVEGHTSAAAPTDRGTVDHASRQRLGNVPPDPVQDLNPESGVRSRKLKTGTELTLEESGLEDEMRAPGLEDRR